MTALSRKPRLGVAAALLAVGGLAACSSGWAVGSAATSSAAVSSAARVPPAADSTAPDAGSAPTSAESSAPPSVAVTAPPLTGGPVATDSPRPRKTAGRADVVLSVLGWDARSGAVQAGGYVSAVIQAGGTCTLELTMGARKVAVSAAAEPDASTTVCGNLSVGRAKVVPGSWTAVLRYSSSTVAGASAPATVQVPR